MRKNQIQKNLLAFQLINEFFIHCPNRACTWKGRLEEVTIHLPKCAFKTNELPDWFNRYLASREQEFERVEAQDANLDDDLRDKLN